jgi:hypothetical protein
VITYRSNDFILGQACKWRTFVGCRWGDGKTCRHESIRTLRVGKCQSKIVIVNIIAPTCLTNLTDPNAQNIHRGKGFSRALRYSRLVSFQAARVLLRVDDIVQAKRKDRDQESAPQPQDVQAE